MATVITGASAGLGEGFARALAAEGKDLILTARRGDRLDTLAAELRGTGVKVDLFAADLADPAAPTKLIADIAAAGLGIDTLINNAGFGLRGPVADLDTDQQLGMIDVNCRALVALSRAVLPGMIAAGQGGILNVASTAAFQPGPWMSVYYATKAFVLSFSEGLHEEVKDRGIRVAALCPGPTRTEFAEVAGMGDSALFQRFASDADAVVRDGLKALAANQAVKISGAMNLVSAEAIRFTPRGLARRIAGSLQKGRAPAR
ncbi:SDR family NAD(P)-dependent oxidoreductase [Sphingomonas oligophenolica]|uniref:SDR family oxidoreductase n=1 Tax=Sphingomonas oligophenolica TaxID=301154 RepID=A0A502CLL9_9SPHN|nr:SDR family oxidoreductase [Sphingomonas oligophenolica]TPG13723.1 SDR family oxidoreductase [Sphingomonas oligophenolica]